jgi:O-antigen/teichoic acid export membrane protein
MRLPARPVPIATWRFDNRIVRESAAFTASALGVSTLSAIATIVVARHLTTADFGAYAFCLQFLLLAGLVFELGLSLPSAREAAAAKSSREKRIVAGAALRIFAPVAILFGIFTLTAAGFVDSLFNVEASSALMLVAPLAFVYPASQFILRYAQGASRIVTYSVVSAIGQAVALALAFAVMALPATRSASGALLARSAGLGLGWLLFALALKPALRGVRFRAKRILEGQRRYGLHAYVGLVLSMGTYSMDVLMLGAFRGAVSVALYALAGQIATTAGQPVTSLAAAVFSPSAHRSSIDRSWLLASVVLGSLSVAALVTLGRSLVAVVFSARYIGAATLLLPLALAQLLRGVTSIYNSFLAAHTRGKELRNTGIVLTVSNVAFNVALIPTFGAVGAAWASFFALGANLLAHIFWYRRAVSSAAIEMTRLPAAPERVIASATVVAGPRDIA